MTPDQNPTNFEPTKNATNKATKQRIIVAVLLFGLLIAICTQPETQSPTATDTAASSDLAITNVAKQAANTSQNQSLMESLATVQVFSRLSLDSASNRELFPARPSDLVAPVEATQQSAVKIDAVYGSASQTGSTAEKRRVALIGDTVFRSGNFLPDGRFITDVTSGGIRTSQPE
ncbi:MAG: hypothetical protein HKN47_07000 [Pirellulaceae bacterium]|nr:hypothetical protein [Pirellulaceae bacterium]